MAMYRCLGFDVDNIIYTYKLKHLFKPSILPMAQLLRNLETNSQHGGVEAADQMRGHDRFFRQFLLSKLSQCTD